MARQGLPLEGNMKERRQHARVGIRVVAACEVEGGGRFAAVATDIGLGGARVECELVPGYGTQLTLVLNLPGASEPSRLPATIRWTSPGACGVQFGALGARDTNRIARLIEQRKLDTIRIDYLDESDLEAHG
jgi:hypothetical protein